MLIVLSAIWAMLMNVVRITAIALADTLAGWDWAEGLPHTLVGLAGFGFALLTIYASDWLVNALLAPVGERWGTLTGEPIRFGKRLVDLWDYVVGDDEANAPQHPTSLQGWQWWRLATGSLGFTATLASAVAFASVGVLESVAPARQGKVAINFSRVDEFAEALQVTGVLPQQFGELRLQSVALQKRDAGSLFASHSVVFVYANDQKDRYLVSCDFPYVGGWHELSVCYRGIGWRLDNREVKRISEDQQSACDAAFLDLSRPDGVTAYVAFCGRYTDGEPVPAAAMTLAESFWIVFSRRASAEHRNSYQTQVLTEDAAAISDRRREQSRQLLEEAQMAFSRVAQATLTDSAE